MSQARTTKVDFDLAVLKQVAEALGYVTSTGATRGWAGRNIMPNAELVIKPRHGYDMGFRRTSDTEVDMKADHHAGHVDKDLIEIVPAYVDRMAEIESGGRFRNPQKIETEESIQLRYTV